MPPQPVAFYGATPACAEQAEQDAEVRKLVTEYHATQDENRRARIEKELPALIAKEFDARQEAREQELKQLKEQLQKLQELHVKRSKQKEQIVEERVRQLLRDAEGLGWGSDSEMPMGLSIDPAVGPRHVYSTGTIIGKRP